MKQPPIVTIRDARLSLWMTIAESILKKQNPDLNTREIRGLPEMRGLYAHVAEASGKPQSNLDAGAQQHKTQSQTIYNLAVSQPEVLAAEVSTRDYSDADSYWYAVGGEWLIAVNAREYEKANWYEKVWKALKTGGYDDVAKWFMQSSDANIQQNLITYRKWHDASQGLNYSLISWQLPNDAKVVMLGDWGTSLDDAKQLLKAIWSQENPAAFVHLGDIYYTGSQDECQDNFLGVFQAVASELGKSMVPIYTIPGNHEYYSFGDGFFWLVDNVNKNLGSSKVQAASYFCLRTQDSKWQFLAMDTGQDDNNPAVTALDPFAPQLMGDRDNHGELAWHVDKLSNFSGQTIMMSHHQLFTRSSNVIDKKVQPYFSRYLHSYFSPFFNKIAVWFWGHEHSFAIYANGIYGLAKGRLLGSSSYEEATSNAPYTNLYPLVPYVNNMPEPNASEGYYDHACAVIDFKRNSPNDEINVRYYTFPSWGQDENMPVGAALGLIYQEGIGASTMKGIAWSGNNTINSGHCQCKNTPSLSSDGSKVYMVYRNTNDNLHYATFNLSSGNWSNDSNFNVETSHSPCINAYNGNLYLFYADKNDSDKIAFSIEINGKWSKTDHINDDNYKAETTTGISAAWLNGVLYIAFADKGSNNIMIGAYSDNSWSFSKPTGNPETSFTPGLTEAGGTLYLVYADKDNGDHMAVQTYNGSWTSKAQVTNDNVISSENMAMPKPHDNVSLVTEYDGKITAFYRGKDNVINWLTYVPSSSIWYGGVSLPRISNDKEVPLTSNSAGAAALSNGVYLCFNSKSTSDIRWARRTDS